jgi:CRP-like cAMP-binding protein
MRQLSCMAELWFFQQLTLEEKQHLKIMARRQTYGTGAMLSQEGEPATAGFLITAGRIRLYKSSADRLDAWIISYMDIRDGGVDLLTNQHQVSSE